jgi:hypothetical protein
MTTTPDDAPPPHDPDGDPVEQEREADERTETETADPVTGEPVGTPEAAVQPRT